MASVELLVPPQQPPSVPAAPILTDSTASMLTVLVEVGKGLILGPIKSNLATYFTIKTFDHSLNKAVVT